MHKIISVGEGKDCPKCGVPMERRKHREKPKSNFFYSEWDYCLPCKHIQHYEEYKSSYWREDERQENHLFNIMKEE